MEFHYSASRYATFVNDLLLLGTETSPHGTRTVEIVNANIIVANPRERLIADPARKMNVAFAIKEFAQYITGDARLDFVTDVNPKMRDFAFRDRVDAAYGPRLIDEQQNQIEQCIVILQQDPDSRQAILSIWRKDDLWKWSNKPCTISLQFLLRNNRLNCIATMRSCDILWGFSYDMFSFTMLQEYVAVRLGAELGMYYHNVGSLHAYVDRDMDLITKLEDTDSIPMEPMTSLDYKWLESFYEQLKAMQSTEILPRFWEDLLLTVHAFKARKETAKFAFLFSKIKMPTLQQMLKNYQIG